MRACTPLFVVAFLTDASVYLVFAALPFRAIALGAGPLALGIIPGLHAAMYMIASSAAGRLSDRIPRLALARFACLGLAVAAVALAAAPSLPFLLAALPLLGGSLGFFWSPVQAAVSDRAAPRELGRTIGIFNVSWTLGKGCGLVLGGLLTATLGPRVVFLAGVVPALVVVAVLRGRESSAPTSMGEPHDTVSDAFLRLAWISNALAYGLVGTVNMHGARLLLARGAGPSDFGFLLGSVFGVQALTFLLLRGRRVGAPLLSVALAAGCCAALLLPALPGDARLAAAIPFGLLTGVAYQGSLWASLHRPAGRGRAAGQHETILSAGSSSVPLAGGVAASLAGSLVAPFLVAATLLASGALATAVHASRATRATRS